jgi:hypothetical protein
MQLKDFLNAYPRAESIIKPVVEQLHAFETQRDAVMATQLRADVQDQKVGELKAQTRASIDKLRPQLAESIAKLHADREGAARARALRAVDLGPNPSSSDMTRATIDRLARVENTLLLIADLSAISSLSADEVTDLVGTSLMTNDEDRIRRVLSAAERRLSELASQNPQDRQLQEAAGHVRTTAAEWKKEHPSPAEELQAVQRERQLLEIELDRMLAAAGDVIGRRQEDIRRRAMQVADFR